MEMVMVIVSAISFAAGLWVTSNSLEFWVEKKAIPRPLNYWFVAIWTAFAWSQGLFDVARLAAE